MKNTKEDSLRAEGRRKPLPKVNYHRKAFQFVIIIERQDYNYQNHRKKDDNYQKKSS